MEPSNFRIIIIGGSVAGLTLAHCLHRANIDFLVLEKGNRIAPELGASIGIMPNGGRILDQLGLFEEIERETEPLNLAHITYPDGFSFTNSYPRVINERFGFPIAFLSRKKFLEIVYQALVEKEKILTNKRVVDVRYVGGGVCAVTDDGNTYEGRLIVGADGVHSQIRSEIWRKANENAPGTVTEEEKQSITVEYACVFGISSQIEGIQAGEQINAFLDGATVIAIQGKDERTFWFVFKKLDRKYVYPNVPKFSLDDAAELCSELRDVQLYKNIRLKHIWKAREIVTMTALEEVLFKTWYHDRMVLVGDSVHKMTPNFGQGANCAIEDAATLASLIHRFIHVEGHQNPSDLQMNHLLREYQSVRYIRMRQLYNDSWSLCRLQARDGAFYKLMGRYYAPYVANLPADLASKDFADSSTLEFLSLPGRSGTGWVQYSKRRWQRALPYLGVTLFLSFLVHCGIFQFLS